VVGGWWVVVGTPEGTGNALNNFNRMLNVRALVAVVAIVAIVAMALVVLAVFVGSAIYKRQPLSGTARN